MVGLREGACFLFIVVNPEVSSGKKIRRIQSRTENDWKYKKDSKRPQTDANQLNKDKNVHQRDKM